MEPGRSPDGALPNGEHKGVTTVRCAGRTLRQNQVIGSGQLNVPCLIDRRTRACGPKRGGGEDSSLYWDDVKLNPPTLWGRSTIIRRSPVIER